MTAPITTLYVFRFRGRPVAFALGLAPPDPGCAYDSLLRIPVVTNGDRPPWRAFVWGVREPIGQAVKRGHWRRRAVRNREQEEEG